jgi:hypothetical protein
VSTSSFSHVVRVMYVDESGKLHGARTLEAPDFDGRPIKLLVTRRGARIEIIEAKYSKAREPGTWSRVVESA